MDRFEVCPDLREFSGTSLFCGCRSKHGATGRGWMAEMPKTGSFRHVAEELRDQRANAAWSLTKGTLPDAPSPRQERR